MANIITELTARIEDYRSTNKNPCKNYATQAAAEKATAKMAQAAAIYFDKQGRVVGIEMLDLSTRISPEKMRVLQFETV